MHIYKDFESKVLLEMIPVSDVINFYGISNIIDEIGTEELLSYLFDHQEEDFLKFIESQKVELK